jgi:1,2-diacylglycerol-3-alpha-glucose alpha-1,2-galactosyltransferase
MNMQRHSAAERIKINVCSETALLKMKGEGVNTAFVDCVELLEEQQDAEVVVNQEGRGDVMHSHTYGPYYFLKGLGYRNRKILTVHVIPDSIKGSLPWSKTLMPFVKWYFKQVYSYADVVIAISPSVEKTIRQLGVRTRIFRLDNPLHLSKWKRTNELRVRGRKLLGLKENDFCVLGVGQIQPRKGPEDFIEIGKQIPQAQFRWAGGRPFGAMTEGIKRLNEKIATAPSHIQFSGLFSLEEMPAVYAAADMLLFLSYQENSPLAPVEAAASGMPVIYRDLNEYKTLYQNEYWNASTNEQFVDWVKRLMSNQSLYEAGVAVSTQLISQFDKVKIRRKLMNLYKDVIHNSTAQNGRATLSTQLPARV